MQSRLIAVALYGLLGIAAVATACVVFPAVARRGAPPPSTVTTSPDAEMQFSLVRPGKSTTSSPSGFTTPETAAELARLQALLEQKEARLQKAAADFEQVSRQYESLRREYDDALQIAAALLSSEFASEPAPIEPAVSATEAALPPAEAAPVLPVTEVELLQFELEQAQMRLADSQQQLTELRLRAEQELAAMLVDQLALRQTASEALVRVGAEATPILADLLESQDVDVRMWAAQLLGDIGPTAREAIPTLRLALSDSNEQVRAAARRALDRIEGITGN